MTVSTTTNKIIYNGLIGQSVFAYNFRVDEKEDMNVFLAGEIIDAGDWTIDGLGDNSGGNVTLNDTLTVDQTVTLLREVDETQQVDYQPFDAFPAETHEGALDKLTMLVQQLQEEVDRAPTQPVDSTLTNYNLGTPVAEKLIQYRADETGQEASIYTVDELIANSGGDETRSTAPPDPKPGDGWWDTETGKAYVWYEDGSSNQWVERIPVPQYNDVFDAKLDGYESTGQHKEYQGDLDAILVNSTYNIVGDSVTNEPDDFNSPNWGFITTYMHALSAASATQTLYGMNGSNLYKVWMRQRNSSTWDAWVLVVDGGAFTLRLAGYQDDGTHDRFIGDVDTLAVNSTWLVQEANSTNLPPDMPVGSLGYLHTYKTGLNISTNARTQVLYGNLVGADAKIWMRANTGSSFTDWVLVVDGAAPSHGSFTVSLWDALTSGNKSPTEVTGYWNKVDNLVTVRFFALNSIDTTGMTGGNVLYVDMPFPSSTNGRGVGSIVTNGASWPTNRTSINSLIASARPRAQISASGNGESDQNMAVSDITGAQILNFNLTYAFED